MQTNGLPAQYGLHPGGVVNIVTKSGSQCLPRRPVRVSAQRRSQRPTGGCSNGTQPKRDSLKRNQFGGTVGGRIIKDRLFFFGGYQGTRQRSDPSANTAYVPTAAVLQGNFSVVDAAKSAGGCLSSCPAVEGPVRSCLCRQPDSHFLVRSGGVQAGLQLPAEFLRIPAGLSNTAISPTTPTTSGSAAWITSINDKHSFFGRYYTIRLQGAVAVRRQQRPDHRTIGQPGRNENMTIGDTYTLSPTMVNSFHVTANRRRDNRAVASNDFSPEHAGREYVGGAFQLHAAHCQQLLRRRVQHRLRHVRAGHVRRQHVSGVGRFHVDSGQTPVLVRLRRPQEPVQLGQQPAGGRAIHVQRRHHGGRHGRPPASAASPA